MKILIIRHGQTDWNIQGKIQGRTDIELNQTGINQAKEASKLMEKEKIDVVISSPMKRTKQTTEIIMQGRNVPVIYDDRIMERAFGIFEGKFVEEYNDELNGIWDYKLNKDVENGENIGQLIDRVYNFLDEIKEKYKDKNILIVTHGGVIRAIKYYFEETPKDGELRKMGIHNCQVIEYEV